MKKYVIGFIAGALTMTAFSVSAEVVSTMIGKSIDNEYVVQLNGEELSTKAISIEGTSYAPVRVVGEALGLNVDFENEVVILENEKEQLIENKNISPYETDIEKSIQRNLENIQRNNEELGKYQSEIENYRDMINNNTIDQRMAEMNIKFSEQQIEKIKEANVELERRITEARAKLAQ